MRQTLFVSEAISRIRPLPLTTAVDEVEVTAVHRCQYVAWNRPQ